MCCIPLSAIQCIGTARSYHAAHQEMVRGWPQLTIISPAGVVEAATGQSGRYTGAAQHCGRPSGGPSSARAAAQPSPERCPFFCARPTVPCPLLCARLACLDAWGSSCLDTEPAVFLVLTCHTLNSGSLPLSLCLCKLHLCATSLQGNGRRAHAERHTVGGVKI